MKTVSVVTWGPDTCPSRPCSSSDSSTRVMRLRRFASVVLAGLVALVVLNMRVVVAASEVSIFMDASQ